MINTLNRQIIGTGGGGASASIYVTGLSQTDSATMTTPSGGTVQGVWDEVEKYEATEVPKMTSNSMDGFVASLQSNSSGSANNAYTAFNGSTTYASDYKAYLANSIGNYIQIQFPTPIVPTRFTGRFMLNHYSSWGAVPRTIVWELMASVDGVTFVSLDTITTIATTSGGLTYIDYSTDISSADAYKYYRIVITGGNATPSQYGGMGCSWQIYGLKQTTIPCFRLLANEYGTHTITASNGTKTSTEEVLVDALMDYWVEIILGRLWLYKYGDERTSLTGGWIVRPSQASVTELTRNVDYLSVKSLYSSGHGYAQIQPLNALDFTGYSTLKVRAKASYSSYFGLAKNGDWVNGYISISTSSDYAEYSQNITGIASTNQSVFLGTQERSSAVTLDIEAVWLE